MLQSIEYHKSRIGRARFDVLQLVNVRPRTGACAPSGGYRYGDCPPPGCALPGSQARMVPGRDASGDCREMAIGVNALAVAISTRVVATLVARATLCVKRLVITTELGDGFLIHGFNINSSPQLVMGAAIHSSTFTPDAVGVGLKGDCVDPGSTIEFDIENLSSAATQNFFATLIGPATAA